MDKQVPGIYPVLGGSVEGDVSPGVRHSFEFFYVGPEDVNALRYPEEGTLWFQGRCGMLSRMALLCTGGITESYPYLGGFLNAIWDDADTAEESAHSRSRRRVFLHRFQWLPLITSLPSQEGGARICGISLSPAGPVITKRKILLRMSSKARFAMAMFDSGLVK